MELPEALDIVVGRTGHLRYRQLCDPTHPDFDPGCEPTILAMASSVAPQGGAAQSGENPSVAQSWANIAQMKACPSWEAASDCGCGNNRCKAGKGNNGVVSHQDCFACLGLIPARNDPARNS